MDADERLTALKRAYADIILNTAKEAAARIMVSERKAMRYQHELNVAKEDALQMLLRLKRMMDAKSNEAEITSLNQQKKIDELEAQLQEAEDIVRDLRDELREVQAELERVGINEEGQGDDCTAPEEISEELWPYASQPLIFHGPVLQHESFADTDVTHSNLNHISRDLKCHASTFTFGNSCIGKSELPSIILRSKEPQLCRNGYTHRILACERNMLNVEFSHDVKIESTIKASEEDENSRKAAGIGIDVMANSERKVDVHSCRVINHGQAEHKISKRVGSDKSRTSSGRNLPGQFTEANQDSVMLCLRTHLTNDVSIPSSEEDPCGRNGHSHRIYEHERNILKRRELSLKENLTDPKIESTVRAAEGKKCPNATTCVTDTRTNLGKKVSVLSGRSVSRWQHKKASCKVKKRSIRNDKSRNSSARYLPKQLMKSKKDPDISCLRNLNIGIGSLLGDDTCKVAPKLSSIMPEVSSQPELAETTEAELGSGNASSIQTKGDQEALVNEVLPTSQESVSSISATVPSYRMALQKDDSPLLNFVPKTSDATNAIVHQPANDRIIKYTFQRKRKRESLSCPDTSASLEKSTSKRKMGEKPSAGLQSQTSLMTESSRDSRRLAQVARQLISLSESKWWH